MHVTRIALVLAAAATLTGCTQQTPVQPDRSPSPSPPTASSPAPSASTSSSAPASAAAAAPMRQGPLTLAVVAPGEPAWCGVVVGYFEGRRAIPLRPGTPGQPLPVESRTQLAKHLVLEREVAATAALPPPVKRYFQQLVAEHERIIAGGALAPAGRSAFTPEVYGGLILAVETCAKTTATQQKPAPIGDLARADLRRLMTQQEDLLTALDRYGSIADIEAQGGEVTVSRGVTVEVVRYDTFRGVCLRVRWRDAAGEQVQYDDSEVSTTLKPGEECPRTRTGVPGGSRQG